MRFTRKTSLCLLLLGLLLASSAFADSTFVHCTVFLDTNEDGVRDGGEPALSSIRITNGVDVFSTNALGETEFWVDRAVYRFATLTVPAGFRATTPWFVHYPASIPVASDSVSFGLFHDPSLSADPVRWVHVSDTQVKTWGDSQRFEDDLLEINELVDAPRFLVNTGDLVEVASDSTHWNNYLSQIQASNTPIFHAVGNHDTLDTAEPLLKFEELIGPPYYSFESGSWHFIVYNSEVQSVATPRVDDWLDADVAAAPPGSHLALFMHRMVVEWDFRGDIDPDHWETLGIGSVFSGHWHSMQFSERPQGIQEFNLSRTRSGPLDRTPRAFGIVECQADGTVDYELRRLAVDHQTKIAHPRYGATVFGDELEILVQAYDTSSSVTQILAVLTAPAIQRQVMLTRDGLSLWRGTIPLVDLPAGQYDLGAFILFEDGTPRNELIRFEYSDDPEAARVLDHDWPMFRKSAAGSSYTSNEIVPPLRLAWSQRVDGLVALSSPVVADSKVYLGTRTETGQGEGNVAAFDARTGAPQWSTPVTAGVALAPAVNENVVLVNTLSDSAFALDPDTGARLWSKFKNPGPGWGRGYDMSAPVLDGASGWLGIEPRLRQVTLANGLTEWSSPEIGVPWFPSVYSAPALGDIYVYSGAHGLAGSIWGGFSVMERATGNVSSSIAGIYRSPVFAGDRVFRVGGSNINAQLLSCLDASGTILHWAGSQVIGQSTGSPALAHDRIVVPSDDGEIFAFSTTNGAFLWSHATGDALWDVVNGLRGGRAIHSTPAIAGNTVWFGSTDGCLYGLDLATGNEVEKWCLGVPVSSSPAISGNMLFIGASDGHLYAFTGVPPVGTDVSEPESGRATILAFYPPRPNPSHGMTKLAWTIPRDETARVDVFDVTGRRIRTLAKGVFEAGEHEVVWDGRDESGHVVASGLYFARLSASSDSRVVKIVRVAP